MAGIAIEVAAIHRPYRNADEDAVKIAALYSLARDGVRTGAHHLIEIGQRLLEKKASLPHGKWESWLKENEEILGFEHPSTARRLLQLGKHKTRVDAPFTDDEAVEICRTIWGNKTVRGTEGTGDNEWYTPAEYVEAARTVLGEIDLDPASNIVAQATVKAAAFFTREDDGLKRDWHGRVWLNPPYAQPFIAQFVTKLVGEVRAGRVTAAILLTHNYTDTAWFHEIAGQANGICFTRGRIKFCKPDRELAAPTQGQAFSYFGADVEAFLEVFREVGFVTEVRR